MKRDTTTFYHNVCKKQINHARFGNTEQRRRDESSLGYTFRQKREEREEEDLGGKGRGGVNTKAKDFVMAELRLIKSIG